MKGSIIALGILLLSGCDLTANASNHVTVHIRELTAGARGRVGRAVGMRGDFIVAGGSLRVLVGGPARRPRDRGRVLAVESPGGARTDDLEFIAPVIVVDDNPYEVRARSFTVTDFADRRALRTTGSITVGGNELEVERIVTIADTGTTLAISTRVDGEARALSIGERVAWGGQPPFAPWVGRIADDRWHAAEWIGTEGSRRSIALGMRGAAGRLRAQIRNEGGHAELRSTDFVARAPRDGSFVRALYTFDRGGFAAAIRRLGWARGQHFREASVGLSFTPPQAAVRVHDAQERPWIHTRIDASQRMQLPLPRDPRPLVVHATAYGYRASTDSPIAPGRSLRLTLPASGRLRVAALDAATGAAIPFRARLAGIDGTERPTLGPIWSAAGARDMALSSGEALEVSVPTGEYDVIVSHGPEWTIARQRIVVTGVGMSVVSARLRRAVDARRWVPSDFHLHAEPSPDSHVTLADRIAALAAEGVRFAAATDHNHVTDYAPVVREMNLEIDSVTGVELTTADPAFGHFNAFPYPLDPTLPANGAPEFSGLTPARMFAGLREAAPDAIVQVNHPRLEGIGYFDQTSFVPGTGVGNASYSDDYDAIEVWNGFELAEPARVERNLAEWISMLARGRRVVATGNSDSHTISTELAGYPRTYVDTSDESLIPTPTEPPPPAADAPDAGVATVAGPAPIPLASRRLLAALRLGRAFVTNGPFLDLRVEGLGPGHRIVPEGVRVRVEVRVYAPSWMAVDSVDVYLGDRIVETFPITARRARPDGLRFFRRIDLPVDHATFVLAVVRGEATMDDLFVRRDIRPFAFTNPVWIDVRAPEPSPAP